MPHPETVHTSTELPAEPRWPGAAAVIAVRLLNVLLPSYLLVGPGWLVVAGMAVLAAAALLIEPWHIWLGYTTSGIATFVLGRALWVLVESLTAHRGKPADLLLAAVVLWSMNIIVFASWYWRLDEGGPHLRSKQRVYFGSAFLFPQLTLTAEARKAIGAEHWRPRFVDYLFLAFNVSTAFSPTDVPVLSGWAKGMMMIQASISLATLAMVAARAVNIL